MRQTYADQEDLFQAVGRLLTRQSAVRLEFSSTTPELSIQKQAGESSSYDYAEGGRWVRLPDRAYVDARVLDQLSRCTGEELAEVLIALHKLDISRISVETSEDGTRGARVVFHFTHFVTHSAAKTIVFAPSRVVAPVVADTDEMPLSVRECYASLGRTGWYIARVTP